jgi:ketosteroid isomerase-like protein
MDLAESKSTVLEFLDAMAKRDVEGLRVLLHENARWWVPQSVAAKIERPLIGRDRVVHLASGQTFGAFRPNTTTWDVKHLTAEGDFVAILMHRRALSAKGRPYDNLYHWLFRFELGLIAEVWEVLDTALAAQELWT